MTLFAKIGLSNVLSPRNLVIRAAWFSQTGVSCEVRSLNHSRTLNCLYRGCDYAKGAPWGCRLCFIHICMVRAQHSSRYLVCICGMSLYSLRWLIRRKKHASSLLECLLFAQYLKALWSLLKQQNFVQSLYRISVCESARRAAPGKPGQPPPCPAVPLSSHPPLVTLEAPWRARFESQCFWHAAITEQKLSTQQLPFMMRKVAERPEPSSGLGSLGPNLGSWWAFRWTCRVTETGFEWDHHREFLNWPTRGAEIPRRTGVFRRSVCPQKYSILWLYCTWVG